MPGIRLATAADVAAMARSQARAFFDDPVQRWVMPDDGARLAELTGMFEVTFTEMNVPLGAVYTDDACTVVACWAPPGRWKPDDDTMRRLAPITSIVGAPGVDRLGVLVRHMADAHPRSGHWYLAGLGTDPDHQGRGLGSAAMEPVLARCDAERAPAYLESSKERNIAFYERHGFVVTGRIDIPGGPSLWPMWRPPRPLERGAEATG